MKKVMIIDSDYSSRYDSDNVKEAIEKMQEEGKTILVTLEEIEKIQN